MQEYDEGRILFKQKGKVVTVGLTEKALEEIGALQTVSLPTEGDECVQDDAVGEVEGVKATFEIIAPMDGTIETINDPLNEDIEILATDPLDEGWIFKMRVTANAEGEDADSEE